ncbi:MAG: flagellar hook-basal body complex protein FliE [Bryobacteraceae bacterium]
MPSITPFQPIQDIPFPESIAPLAGGASGSDAFSSILQQSVQNVSQLQGNAETSINQFISGEQEDPHTTMIAVQRASLAFDMFVQVRNKVVQAYQEVMKMPE